MSDDQASPKSSTWTSFRNRSNALFARKPLKTQCMPKQTGDSPFLVEFVMVQCVNFVCMAYQDKNEVWRNAYNNDVLPEPVQVLG